MREEVLKSENIRVTYLSTWFVDLLRKLPRFLYLVYAVLRLVTQSVQLLWVLLFSNTYSYIVIQNPPCLPLLLIAILIQTLTKTKVVIDWHNYGFSILAVNRTNKFLVKAAKHYEVFLGRFGWRHLTVSKAMKTDLATMTGIRPEHIQVLYDRATPKFAEVSERERRELFGSLGLQEMLNE